MKGQMLDRGSMLLLGREVAMDAALISVDHLAAEEREEMDRVVAEAEAYEQFTAWLKAELDGAPNC